MSPASWRPASTGSTLWPLPASCWTARERESEVSYYNNEYLVLLTADTVRETEFSDYTMIACGLLMDARAK